MFHWFGDSWVNGDELEDKNLSFPAVFSRSLNTEFKVYAKNASSIPNLLIQFDQAIYNLTPGDVCFFGLTSPDRTMLLKDQEYHFYPAANLNKDSRVDLELNKLWYKYFDSEQNRQFVCSNTLDALNGMCKHIGVTALFYNLFCTNTYKTITLDDKKIGYFLLQTVLPYQFCTKLTIKIIQLW